MRAGPVSSSGAQPHRPQPSIDLTERILLPLIGRPASKNSLRLREQSHARGTVAVERIEFVRDVSVRLHGARMRKQRAARNRKLTDAAGKIPDAVVDVVRVLLFLAKLYREPLHGQERGNGSHCDLNSIAIAIGHTALELDELWKEQRELGAGGALNGEIRYQRRGISNDGCVARHQEID